MTLICKQFKDPGKRLVTFLITIDVYTYRVNRASHHICNSLEVNMFIITIGPYVRSAYNYYRVPGSLRVHVHTLVQWEREFSIEFHPNNATFCEYHHPDAQVRITTLYTAQH